MIEHLHRKLKCLRNTPLHPQWLLGSSKPTREWVVQNVSAGYVLDIGCADRWIEKYLPKECKYIGFDYPATGRDLYGAKPDVFGDAASLPFADNSMDTVVLLEVLEHVRHPEKTLSEIERVLKPGGILLLSMPFLYPVHDAPYDFQRYTCHGLAREIEVAGMYLEQIDHSLDNIRSAGLLLSLALGGAARESLRQKKPSVILLPLLLFMIPVINMTCWLLSKIMPEWSALTAGYRLKAKKHAV